MAHFFYIHFGLPTYFKNVFEGHIASQYLHNVGRPDVNDLGTSYGEAHLDSEASYFGPSFMINWLHNNYGGFKAESILINCHYPVSQDSFMLQWGVIVEKPKGLDEKTTEKLATTFTDGVSKGFLQDVEIWKHKTRIDNPLLVEEDGAVYQMRRWYQQFYVDVADVTPDMTDRFEVEVDTTAANEKWHVEVEENLKTQAEEKDEEKGRARELMTPRKDAPDVDQLARSMLLLHGVHDDDDHAHGEVKRDGRGSWSKAPTFGDDRAEALREATARDRERYLTSGLVSVDCRFCHVAVDVKKLGPATHLGAMEHRGDAALRLLRRNPRVRRRSRAREVLPEARGQHQTRCRRRLPGGDVHGASARRRLTLRLTAMVARRSGLLARHRVDRLHPGRRHPPTPRRRWRRLPPDRSATC